MLVPPVHLCTVIIGALAVSTVAIAEQISFEQFTGPALFGSAQQTLTIPTSIGFVAVSGGAILQGEANLPADQTSVYATAHFDDLITGYSNPVTLSFPQPINNFFLDVYNGNTENIDYTVADNQGHSSTFNLPDNFSSGQSLIGFAATGNKITILAGPSTTGVDWDFSIDNVTFNEPLPPSLTPEPESLGTVGLGLVLGALLVRKYLQSQNTN